MKTGRLYATLAKADYKKGTRKGWGNYKPVSIKSVPGKITDRSTLGAIEKHVKDKAIIRFLLAAHSLQGDRSCTPDPHILFPTSVKLSTEHKVWLCLFYEMMLFLSNKLVSVITDERIVVYF